MWNSFAGMTATRRKFVVASLNYELLVELAAERVGRHVTYSLHVPKDHLSVLKPHGSCNFVPDVAPRQFRDFSVVIPDPTEPAPILEAPIRIATPEEVNQFCARENAVAPALALYEKGKDVLFCGAFVKEQQAQFADAVRFASRVFIVGVRVVPEDQHIWLPLARTRQPIYYVGPDPTELFAWVGETRRRRVTHFATTFKLAPPQIIQLHSR
jgi:hypothetical protein